MIGWIISQPLEKRRDRLFVTTASVVPDFDGAGALISIDYYSEYHHVFGHNLFFGLLLLLVSMRLGFDKRKVPLLGFISFNSHILGDLLGSGAGWGIPYFWPLDKITYEFSYPYQWELDSWQNLVVTVICIFVIIALGYSKKRTIVELFSASADLKVVEVIDRWFVIKK